MLSHNKHRVECPCVGAYYLIGARTLEKHQQTYTHKYYLSHGYPIDRAICLID